MPFYEPAEIRARSDVIVKSGLSQKAEDLLLTQIALKYPRILPHHRPRHSCTMASCSSCAAMLLGTGLHIDLKRKDWVQLVNRPEAPSGYDVSLTS